MKLSKVKLKEKSVDVFNRGLDFTKVKSEKLREKINLKIRERAIIATKARVAENGKKCEDFNDEELEVIIYDEEQKIIDNLKSKSLIALLALLGLDFLVA